MPPGALTGLILTWDGVTGADPENGCLAGREHGADAMTELMHCWELLGRRCRRGSAGVLQSP